MHPSLKGITMQILTLFTFLGVSTNSSYKGKYHAKFIKEIF